VRPCAIWGLPSVASARLNPGYSMSTRPASTPADLGFAQLLRAHGLRATTPRRAIYGVFAEAVSADASNAHLSAEDVFHRARLQLPELSRTAVSHELGELVEAGLLGLVEGPGPRRYDANASPHHHFRCTECQQLRDIDAGSLDVTLREPALEFERAHVLLEGLCAKCAGRAGAA
jgi:Fur family peroxide stress response transcriptional regulator